MVDHGPTEREVAALDRVTAEFTRELERICGDGSVFDAAFQTPQPEASGRATEDAESVWGVNVHFALTVAREVESGAGMGVFIAALGIRIPPPRPPLPNTR
jgi:hypothetical protein